MTVRLVDDRSDGSIPVRELSDGQLAEIVEWDGDTDEHGIIIQRCGDELISIGSPERDCWNCVPESDEARVRILADGRRLEVDENE